jgi:hypothetical protein
MPYNYLEWPRRLKAVEREYSATRRATDHLAAEAAHHPAILRGVGFPDLGRASENLEGTYIIRLFAEFETALRFFWTTYRPTEPPSRAIDLMNGVAATARIDHDPLEDAHGVRRFRNVLTHNREEPADPIPIANVRHRLNKYLGFMRRPQ